VGNKKVNNSHAKYISPIIQKKFYMYFREVQNEIREEIEKKKNYLLVKALDEIYK
jgi:hypothetical protein